MKIEFKKASAVDLKEALPKIIETAKSEFLSGRRNHSKLLFIAVREIKKKLASNKIQ